MARKVRSKEIMSAEQLAEAGVSPQALEAEPAPATAPADVTGEAPFDASRWGATLPPWSAAHPYTNLHGPKKPTQATVVGNVRVTEVGRTAGSGFRGFSKLKVRLDVASKVEGWRFHDLRRTARTGMSRLRVPRDHAEAAINHLSGRSKLERTYDRHDYATEIIAALSAWQMHVAGLVGSAADLPPLNGEVSPTECQDLIER